MEYVNIKKILWLLCMNPYCTQPERIENEVIAIYRWMCNRYAAKDLERYDEFFAECDGNEMNEIANAIERSEQEVFSPYGAFGKEVYTFLKNCYKRPLCV